MQILKTAKIFIFCLFLRPLAQAQHIYSFDISNTAPAIVSGHLKLGSNLAPDGNKADANSLYFTRNGKPWYPVMGEFHFSRYPKAQWEEAILKMKAAGINIVASYIFWIYVEEEEGKFDWSGNNDLKAFAELCKKHGLYFFARLGPWSHGEVRNGGFPDWLAAKGKSSLRRNNAEYLAEVRRFFTQTGIQLHGLYFKDGGPVIGAQIENEYRFNNAAGLEHLLTLKKLAREAGIDVPYYTATGWPGSDQKQDELIPVWGAYPEAPWDKRTTTLPLSENYIFSALRNDPAIGNDLLGQQEKQTDFRGYRYPYATAEMGGGNQITYHRRPIIEANDVTALSYVKVGAGANLMGYYMFHGGSNPIGKLSTLQESKATKYPNDYPIISYDFLSPLGEWGQLRSSYRGYKTLHTFLNEFGDKLVQYYPSFPDKKPANPADNGVLRCAVRAKNESGFVFISNFQRQLEMKDLDSVQFSLRSPKGIINFPEHPLKVQKNVQAILPFNLDLEGVNLRYAIAQPFCKIEGTVPLFVFFVPEGMAGEYLLDASGVKEITSTGAKITKSDKGFYISDIKAGIAALTTISLKNGRRFSVLTLTSEQIKDAWKARILDKDYLFLSKQELVFSQDNLGIESEGNANVSFSVFPDIPKFKSAFKLLKSGNGIFSSYVCSLPVTTLKAGAKEVFNLSPYKNHGTPLPADNRDTALASAIRYQTNLDEVQGSKYYEITIPAAVGSLNEAYLKINYTGDTGAAYLNGKLIADDFYSGLPMTIGLKRFTSGKPQSLLFQVVPLDASRQIYFEKKVSDHLKTDPEQGLHSVDIVPKYELKLRFLR